MKILIFTLLILSFSAKMNAQLSDVNFDDEDVVFFGIDFTAARMIGSDGFTQPDSIVSSYFDKWNSLLFMEQRKYSVAAALNVSEVQYDLDPVKVHNATVDPGTLVIDKSYKLDEDRVQEVISSLDLTSFNYEDGQGFIFVVESFDKPKKLSYVWSTAFDIATKKVIATERMSGKAKGFGLRNYWGNSFQPVLRALQGATR